MNGTKFLLDTCFILGFYRQEPQVLKIVKQNNLRLEYCYISPINKMEVLGYQNISQSDEIGLTKLLNYFTTLALNEIVENKVINLRKHHKIKLPDAIVLATALTHHCQLLTLDNGLNNKYLAQIQ